MQTDCPAGKDPKPLEPPSCRGYTVVMRKLLLAVMVAAGPAAAQQTSMESLRQGCGFDGSSCSAQASAVSASGGETDRFIQDAIDRNSGLSGELLNKTREGERKLLQKTIDESPTLTKMFEDAERSRTWRDYYDSRRVDAAVASWGSNMKAGYLMCTAAAYATYKTAPPVANVVAGGALWVVGVIAGVGLGLLASVVTGHF